MTRRTIRMRTALIAILVALAAFSCRSPLMQSTRVDGQAEGSGRLTIVLPSKASIRSAYARSLSGNFGEAATWSVTGEGPDGASIGQSFASSSLGSGNTITIELRAGEWDLTVTGYDEAGAALFAKSSTITIAPGGGNALSLVMAWVDGLELAHLAFDEAAEVLTDSAGRLSLTAKATSQGTVPGHVNHPDAMYPLTGSGRSMHLPDPGQNVSSEGGYIDAGSGLDLGESFTVSLWVCPVSPENDGNNKQVLVSTQQTAPANGVSVGSGFTLSLNSYETSPSTETDGILHFETGDGSTYATVSSGTTALAVGVWQHVAVAVDGATNAATLYLDGKAVGSGAVRPGFSRDNALRLCGMRDAFFYTGYLDEFRVYAGALGAPELAALIGRDLFGSGSGTDGDPYLVADAYDLNNVRRLLGSSYRQTDPIDLASSPWASVWSPIGTGSAAPFTGSYDGDAFGIANVIINVPAANYQGLFGYLNGAEVSAVDLTGVNVQGGAHVGALAGYTVDSSISAVTVASGSRISGSGSNVGGIIGYNDGSSMTACSVSGIDGQKTTIEATTGYAGGICGYVEGGPILNGIAVSSFVEVTSTGDYVGGICGAADTCTITASSCSATVSAASYVGGIAGWAATVRLDSTDAVSVYVIGTGERVGGLIGGAEASTTINDCKASGTVSGPTSNYNHTGGFVGHIHNSSIADSASSCTVSGYISVGGIAGSAEGTTISGVSVSDASINGNEALGGFIGSSSGCTISNIVITNPTVTATSGASGGFAGISNSDIRIEDTVVAGASVTCTSGNTGGFVGLASGSTEFLRCGVEGTIGNTTYQGSSFGGFAGRFSGTVTARQSYARVTVTANVTNSSSGGGFAGSLGGSGSSIVIGNCYATGNVNVPDDSAGFIGRSEDGASVELSYCFSSGVVATGANNIFGFIYKNGSGTTDIFSCFFDHDKSALSGTNIPALDITTATTTTLAMQTASTYTGWDTGIWHIVDGAYPTLAWEN